MRSFGFVVLLAAAATALPVDDSISFRCSANKEYSVKVKDSTATFYLCNSVDGRKFWYAKPAEGPESFDLSLPKEDALKLQKLGAVVPEDPARILPGLVPAAGAAGSASAATAQSSAGSLGIQGPLGLGVSGSGSFANAASGAVGGALGVLG